MNLSQPMDKHGFQQITLLANVEAALDIIIKHTRPGNILRTRLAVIKRDVVRAGELIPGHMHGTSLDASKVFYSDMEKAVTRFFRSFDPDAPKVGRDEKGRFYRL